MNISIETRKKNLIDDCWRKKARSTHIQIYIYFIANSFHITISSGIHFKCDWALSLAQLNINIWIKLKAIHDSVTRCSIVLCLFLHYSLSLSSFLLNRQSENFIWKEELTKYFNYNFAEQLEMMPILINIVRII